MVPLVAEVASNHVVVVIEEWLGLLVLLRIPFQCCGLSTANAPLLGA